MFLESKLPVAPQSVTDPSKPKKQLVIEIFVDPNFNNRGPHLRVEPRKVLEAESVSEIIDTIGFPLKGPEAEIVLLATAIAARHGWEPFDQFVDEGRHLHSKLRKDVEA